MHCKVYPLLKCFACTVYVYDICQETAREWHLVWYTSAALSLVAGTSFALFAGRPVTRRQSAHTPAAVTQSVELMPSHCRHHTPTDDEMDCLQPALPVMMLQDLARCGHSSAVLDNSSVQHHSRADLPAAESTPPVQYTHSQMVSIV